MVAKKHKGLGRGLNAIFDIGEPDERVVVTTPSVSSHESVDRVESLSSVVELDLSKIDPNPNQPRTNFVSESIDELAQSIATLGIIQPITVMESNYGRYVIISGERRYKAAKLLNMATVPVYIRTANDETLLEMALVENIQREDLNPMEISISLERLMRECSITQEQLSERIGKSRASISNYIRLLRLPASIQRAISMNEITMGHAKAILSVENDSIKEQVLNKVISSSLSVRQTEQLVKSLSENSTEPNESAKSVAHTSVRIAKLQDRLKQIVSGKVTVSETAKGDKKVTIAFKSDEDLEKLLEKLN